MKYGTFCIINLILVLHCQLLPSVRFSLSHVNKSLGVKREQFNSDSATPCLGAVSGVSGALPLRTPGYADGTRHLPS